MEEEFEIPNLNGNIVEVAKGMLRGAFQVNAIKDTLLPFCIDLRQGYETFAP